MSPIACQGAPCSQPCEQGRACPLRAAKSTPPHPMPPAAPLDFGRLNPYGSTGKAIARPLGMGEPMRRPPDSLPLGALVLAACFVLGYIAGAVSTLLWWVE